MLHKWSEEGREEQVAIFLRWVGILVAFVLIGLIVVAAQKMIGGAAQKIQGTYQSQGGGSDAAPGDAPLNGPATAPGNPEYGVDARAANASYASPAGVSGNGSASFNPSTPAPLLPPSITSSAFAVESQRRAAAESLRPLHDLMQSVKEFDSKTVSSVFSAAGSSGASGPAVAMNFSGENQSDGRDEIAEAGARTLRQRQLVERMIDMSDGIAADIALTAHPDNFAPPLKDSVGEMAREMRVYLATVQLAAAHPEKREQLHSYAIQHLSASEQALQSLDTMVGGGVGSAAN